MRRQREIVTLTQPEITVELRNMVGPEEEPSAGSIFDTAKSAGGVGDSATGIPISDWVSFGAPIRRGCTASCAESGRGHSAAELSPIRPRGKSTSYPAYKYEN